MSLVTQLKDKDVNIAATLFKAPANTEISAPVKQNNVQKNEHGRESFKDMLSDAINEQDQRMKESKQTEDTEKNNLNNDTTTKSEKKQAQVSEKPDKNISLFKENEKAKSREKKSEMNSQTQILEAAKDIIKNEKNNKETVEDIAKEIQLVANILNIILEKINQTQNNESASFQEKDLAEIKDRIKNKIKHTLELLKNAKSNKEIKNALNELEKLSNNESFKKLMKIYSGDKEFQNEPLKSLAEDLPRMINRFKEIIKTIDENKSSFSKNQIKDFKNKSEKSIEQDYKTRFQNRKKIDTGSRHRKSSGSFENNGKNAQDKEQKTQRFNNTSKGHGVKQGEINFNTENAGSKVNFGNEINKSAVNSAFAKMPQAVSKDVLNQVMKNVKYATNGSKKELTIHIKPPELGRINMKLSIENGKVIAKFGVENEKVQHILENNRVTLTKQLEDSGLSVEQIDIELQQGNNSGANSQKFIENVNDNAQARNFAKIKNTETENIETVETDFAAQSYDSNDYFATNVSFTV